jgi:Secretion system C-terminal sorting domain
MNKLKMIKNTFSLLFLLIVLVSQAQTLAVWDFENATTPTAPSNTAANGIASPISLGAAQAASYFTGFSSLKAISTTGFPSTTTPDLTKYYEFTITPNAGFGVNISEISFHIQRSNTGPTGWVLRGSTDNFVTAINVATNTVAVPTVFASTQQTTGTITTNASLQSISNITFRLYGIGASGTSGTMRIDNLTILGTITTTTSSPLITVSKTNIPLGNTTIGTPSPNQTFNVSGLNLTDNISLTAPPNFEISTTPSGGFASTITLPQSSGIVTTTPIYVRLTGTSIGVFSGDITHISSGAITKNVALTGNVTAIVPIINLSVTNLSPLSTTEGVISSTLNYTLSGSFLTDNIVLTAPSGFEISTSNNTGFSPSLTLNQASGSVNNTTIYVRLTGATQGVFNGNITHTSVGAITQNVALIGVVNPPFTGQNYVHLRGNFHSHTSYSDGDPATTPTMAFSYAKLSNNFDFLGVSEHNHLTTISQYSQGVSQAAMETSSTFSALYGMEFGVISTGGHMLIYGVNELVGWDAGNFVIQSPKNDFPSLYTIINNRNAWASMAHPQSGDYNDILGASPYSMAADNAIAGCCIRNGPSTSSITDYSNPPSSTYESSYLNMLDKGYHVGPFIDHDNHNVTFGRTSKGRTVVLAQSNTPVNILAAVKARRFYASDDWNEKVNFTLNGLNLGSIGNVSGNPSITISVTDGDNEVPSKIELFSGVPGSNINATVLASSTSSNTLNYVHSTALSSNYYYFVKVTQADGDLLWTAPIWATKTSNSLPIELVNFSAELQEKAKTVKVSWRAEQTGAAVYEIERSNGGEKYETIGTVKGESNGGAYDYTFLDSKPIEGYAYYRLKQIDTDGSFKFSKIVSVYFKPKYLTLKSISPNPSPDAVNVIFDSEREINDYAYFVYDAEGRAILYEPIKVVEGENKVTINIAKFANGTYFLNVGKRDDRIIQTRFVKF